MVRRIRWRGAETLIRTSGNPPPQLKDRVEEHLAKSSQHHMAELILEVADELDVDELARKSLSFRQFREQVDTWKR